MKYALSATLVIAVLASAAFADPVVRPGDRHYRDLVDDSFGRAGMAVEHPAQARSDTAGVASDDYDALIRQSFDRAGMPVQRPARDRTAATDGQGDPYGTLIRDSFDRGLSTELSMSLSDGVREVKRHRIDASAIDR